ncbi:superfamily II DNA/RNA helicase [Actinocorallia herbida]|uniref:Superfamily II DNA/RNA helicase n=1 Tax=Actinocorallia herbida TaxID=58109 RepID=A0A3N1DC45_9ACTN|nr:superfamily II DNA/RNA helicase [Actinocorallia herbida]
MSDVSAAVSNAAPDEENLPSFAELGLPEALVESLARGGITHPFPIQAASIPDALDGRDILGRGKTGSGKTLGFGLPLMTLLAHQQARPKKPLGLILVPTRELAQQVQTNLEPLGRAVGLRMKTVIGQTSMPRQIDALRRGVEVLVATPGRLKDLMRQGACDLSDVRIAVLDEADHMADMGFLPDVTDILDQVRPGGQRMLFSATLDREVDVLVNKYLNNPITHALSEIDDPVDTMEHHLILVPPKEKNTITAEIANREGRTIIFARTKHGVDRIAKQLTAVGVRAAGLHGGKSQNLRTRTLAEFREGRIGVLVATDVAARGIHVDDVSLVLHVDPPADHKDYMHRAGRTARAGEKGTVVTMVLSHQVRATTSMMRRAGINAERLKVTSMDPSLVKLTGAREPSGEPIPEPIIPEQDKRPARRQGGGGGYGRGPRRGAPRRFRDGEGGGSGEGRPRRDDGGRPFEPRGNGGGYRGDSNGGGGGYRGDRDNNSGGGYRGGDRNGGGGGGYRGNGGGSSEGGYRGNGGGEGGGYRGNSGGGEGGYRGNGGGNGGGERPHRAGNRHSGGGRPRRSTNA